MSKNTCDTVEKATLLLDYTLSTTSNKKRYPCKYKAIVEYIVKINLYILDCLIDANSLNLKNIDEKELRIRKQTQAIRACDKLSRMVEISLRHHRIGSDTSVYWQKLITDVKYMTIAWRASDKSR